MEQLTLSVHLDAESILSSGLVLWNKFYAKILGLLTISPKSAFGGAVWGNVVTVAEQATQAVGIALLVVFFLLGISKSYIDIQELKRPEKIFGLFLRYGFALFAVSKVHDLLEGISNIGIALTQQIKNATGINRETYTLPNEIKEAVETSNSLQGMLFSFIGIAAFLVIGAISIILFITVLSRFFKIYMYFVIAPIPIASLAAENTASMARSFFKNYIGVILQGVVIALACIIFSAMSTYMGDITSMFNIDGASGITKVLLWEFTIILQMFVLVSIVKSADGLVKEFVGN